MEYPILDTIHQREDLLKLNTQQDEQLCREIRDFLIRSVSQTGGHLASNLGVVELTLAIHKVFDTGLDRLVFDVGHQSYVHKILTGRKANFATLRQIDGISGFPKPSESIHDAAIAGHASSAVSVALGQARARTLLGLHHQVIALLGDGALTGGMAYEAMNDAGASGEPLIVILNDNGMSIAPNVGGIAKTFSKLRLKPGYHAFKQAYRRLTKKIPGGRYLYRCTHQIKKRLRRVMLGSGMFEEMGFTYLGPIDGHSVKDLVEILQAARDLQEPVLVHVRTVKGKGYSFAEDNPDVYHGVACFDVATGVPQTTRTESFSQTFGTTLADLAQKDSRICAITAAMPAGTGLSKFARLFPDRFFDVGIAEEHAAAMAAGLAKGGMLPVFAVYSTFLQRSYDQLIHDISISAEHVVLAVDRAGLVGSDGETHNGVFDVGFLRQIPGMTVLCPATNNELAQMLSSVLYEYTGPVAIRYPRGSCSCSELVSENELLRVGSDVTMVAYGPMIEQTLKAAEILEKAKIQAEIIRIKQILPLDSECIARSFKKTGLLLIVEDCIENGCVGQAICQALSGQSGKIILKNHADRFVPHGRTDQLYQRLGLDGPSLAACVIQAKGKL